MLAKSTQFFLNPNGNKTLTQMAKDEPIIIEDIEEGEISDSESVEEISEHDFFQEAGVSNANAVSRDWKRLSSNYANDLAMCGWIQGVQNKPLTEIFVREEPRSDDETNTLDQNGLRWNKVVDLSEDSGDEVEKPEEAEKEEGELEEGELLETETFEISEESVIGSSRESTQNSLEKETKEREFEKRVNSVQELLKTVTVKDAEKSFHGVCSQICVALETLRVMVSEDHVCVVDGLIQQTFSGIQSIRSVFFSGSLEQKDQCRDALSRLLSHVKDQNPALFSPGQMKEFEVMSKLLVADSSLKNVKKEREVPSINGSCISNDSNSSTASFWKLGTVNSDGGKSGRNGMESLKLEPQFGVKGRGDFGPSFNLHMNYDEDSLPSPTREGPPPLSLKKLLDAGEGVMKTRLETNKQEEATVDPALHPYVTDALRAVSSYQQKFGRTSFFTSDRLPSPTPSGDCDDGGGDSHEEVSSSTVGTVKTANSFVPLLPAVVTSGFHSGGGSTVLGPGLTKTAGILGPGSSPNLKVPTKSRDPRLRYSNSEAGDIAAVDLNARPISADNNASKKEVLGGILGTRKHTVVEEPCTDGHSLKRQRNESTDSGVLRDPRLLTGRGGWLEDNSLGVQPKKDQLTQSMEIDVRKLENGDVSSNKWLNTNADLNGLPSGTSNLSASGHAMPVVSLPSLLKDIAAVNPTMLKQLIQMEQQRLAAGVKCISADPVQSTISPPTSNTPVPVSSGNVASTMASELVQRAEGKSQVPAQASSMNSKSELGKVRMKPRDPRRILQHNMVNKSQSLVSEQFKTGGVLPPNVLGLKDNITVRGSTEQATSCSSSQSVPLPDIASQFTTKLKNIADLLSNPQLANTSLIPPQNLPQSLGNMGDKVDASAETISKELQIETDPTSDEGTVALPQPQSPWGDLEQLFEGYDDQQKAAIQKERSRRIEEQNKMFAARKLCLVLDLDHTLLNSAKFLEVDPVHDEILRKKEELDREKPQRHLFRFQHMGMWTKLRPGVWSFLDKASKLFELHLYTMGNKLYATEMAKVLDPTGSLFSGRVISRGDDGDPFDGDERVPKSKDLDGVLGMESGVVIIDDSVRVWPHNKLNLILVERYTYFPCSRRQFGLPGPSLLEIDHDERPEDGTLASSFSVIERIHQNFFSHRSLNDVDVRNILASEQRKILTGCRIVFSRIFPVGEANPHLHPLWQTAEQFGAVCTNQIDDQVTHVVANSLGTDKVNWALSTGRFVVHPGWVEASALLYRRANERDFAVKV